MKKTKLTRRQVLQVAAIGGAGAVLAACAAPAPSAPAAAPAAPAAAAPTDAPKATDAPKPTDAPAAAEATKAPEPTAAPAANIPEVARNKSFVVNHGIDPVGVSNPWATGYTHQSGNALLWEPLFYFAIFADKEVPWLAESGEFNKDFTELTIKLGKGREWSDGTPVTAADVEFTMNTHMKNEKLRYSKEFNDFVKEVKVVDNSTVVISLKTPNPRFKFEYLSHKFDTGMPMMPKHVFEKEKDVTAVKGGMDIVHSGPFKIVSWTADQKIMDLREDWWGFKTGMKPAADVKRFIILKFGDATTAAQKVISNECDACLDLRDDQVRAVVEQNAKVTTHTGKDAPHGYLDWWPNSLWMNTTLDPFSDKNVRRALSLTIDRDKIDEIVYNGAKITTIFPFPLYPGLQKFADTTKELQDKYQPRKFDLEAAGKLMEGAGFAKNADGLWEKGGKTVPCVINGFESIHGDIVPVAVEMLKQGGFDASINFGNDSYQNMADGKPGLYMFGHGASLKDPYAVIELYTQKPVGNSAGANNFSRFASKELDGIRAAMAPLASDDPKFQEQFLKFIELYWSEQIDVPLIQWLHRIPYNQTNWINYPTAANLAGGTNGAYWAFTTTIVILDLKSAKA